MQFIEAVDNRLINLRYVESIKIITQDDLYTVQAWMPDYNPNFGEWHTIYHSKSESVISYAFKKLKDVLVYNDMSDQLMTQEEIEDANNKST